MLRCDLQQPSITRSGSHAILSVVCERGGRGSDKVCFAKSGSSPVGCIHNGHQDSLSTSPSAGGKRCKREYKLEQTPEGNLWRILCKGGDAPGEEVRPDGYRQVGMVVVYVDYLMVLAEPHAKHSFMRRLKEKWTC